MHTLLKPNVGANQYAEQSAKNILWNQSQQFSSCTPVSVSISGHTTNSSFHLQIRKNWTKLTIDQNLNCAAYDKKT